MRPAGDVDNGAGEAGAAGDVFSHTRADHQRIKRVTASGTAAVSLAWYTTSMAAVLLHWPRL